jgi:hypothetical protein
VTVRQDLRRTLPWVLCGVSLSLLVAGGWLRWHLRDEGAGSTLDFVDGVVSALGFVGIPVVGAMIASRVTANSYGWWWCAAGLAYALSDIGEPLVQTAGWPAWVSWVWTSSGFVALLTLLVFVFLLFPTGRLPTHRWRWLARAALTLAPLLVVAVVFVPDPDHPGRAGPWAVQGEAGRQAAQIATGFLYGLFVFVLLAMVALLLRFRRAGPTERRQLTWFVYATALNGSLIVLDTVGLTPSGLANTVLSSAALLLLPVAVGVAMLRYRLFEIDRIVSRTVSYGLLTGCLVALYLVLVALLRSVLEPLTGSSTLAVAASTLAVAAVFNPARRRMQEVVDRHFDRAHYDAGRAVEAFAARLRDQVDLDEIATGLRATVGATVAPDRMAVWLRAPARPGGSAP